ncbi:MAG: hypothetical protein ACR2GN_04615 [Bacteroidia bacterium]
MKFFDKITEIEIPSELIEKAKKFAVAVVGTINYSDSFQFSKEKITDDHFISKIGEEAVKLAYVPYATVKGPDYSIYEAKYKSWSSDLFINETGLAVKTQKRSAALRYGLSWIFQAGTSRRDRILNMPEAWVCFVEFDDLKSGNQCLVYPPQQIKSLTFRHPVLARLKGHKQVVYASDLKIET